MEKRFITIFADVEGDRYGLTLTKNEIKRGIRRFCRDVERVRKEDIREKRAITIDNGKCSIFLLGSGESRTSGN